MRKMEKEKVCDKMQKELSAIIDEPKLSQNGLDNAYKMIDIIKDVKNMEYWDVKCDYYREMLENMRSGDYSREMGGEYSRENNGGNYSQEGNGNYSNNDYDNGNSYRRGRNQRNGQYMHRPNYSRLSGDDTDMDEYRNRKREYSNSRDEGSKGRMLDALEDFMCGVSSMVKQICRDADCREEREIVKKYAREIAEM